MRLAAEGASIVAVDVCRQIDTVPYPLSTPEELASLEHDVQRLGVEVRARQGDVRDMGRMTAIVDEAVEELGGIDIVVANAGVAPMLIDDRPEAWDDGIAVNLTGTMHTIEAVRPAMVKRKRGGSIVIVSSTAGLAGIGGPSQGGLAYVASKHGVVGLMRSYANMLAPDWIRVNSVHPTGVATRMITDDAISRFVAQDPVLSRENPEPNALPVPVVDAVDVSNAVLWLASDEARYVTGVTLPVDAGFLVKR